MATTGARRTRAGFRKSRIGVLMGGLSEERDISLKTGGAVLKALKDSGYDAVGIDAGTDLPERLRRRKVEVAFIALHGTYGEDGCVQGLLEVMGIPYTGSGVRASSVAMDKVASKKIFAFSGISTPGFCEVPADGRVTGLRLPVIVKPSTQGSAIGVTVVRKKAALKEAVKEARRHSGDVFAEEFIEGPELTVAVFEGRAFPVIEIRPKEGLYDYRAKYTPGLTDFLVPAPLRKGTEKRVVAEALAAYSALGCSGAARVDIMLGAEDKPFVLEVNTIPGMTETSLLPKAAAAAGMSYRDLVEEMLENAGLGKF